jgi:hypothetical protein
VFRRGKKQAGTKYCTDKPTARHCTNGGARALAGGEKSGQRRFQQGLFTDATQHCCPLAQFPIARPSGKQFFSQPIVFTNTYLFFEVAFRRLWKITQNCAQHPALSRTSPLLRVKENNLPCMSLINKRF